MTFDDVARLEALADYRVLDTPDEAVFDDIAQLTAKIFGAPMALVTVVDGHRQWFKARVGLDLRETAREHSFCDRAIRADRSLVVEDATLDPRFQTNPLVTGRPHIRFYAGAPLRTPEGHGLGALCIMDESPRTFSEAQLTMLEGLARHVAIELEIRRRVALLEEALSSLRKEQRSKETLAAMMVHDLRSPLASLILLAALVRGADAESGFALEEILAEGDRMRRMLADTLDVCLSELGQLRPRRSDVDLTALARGVATRMERLARAREQAIVLDLPDAKLLARVDPQLIERVLENLVGNAIHYGPARSPITLSFRAMSGSAIRGEVRDAGVLIPREVREQIFEVFERVPGLAPSAHRGHGLGLAFCRLAIGAQGGTIGVGPGAERGNVFYFELPIGIDG